MEHFKIEVNDKALSLGGKQCINTPDDYSIPLNIRNGLPYMSIRPYTDKELLELPQIILTADQEWDPSILDSDLEGNSEWASSQEEYFTGLEEDSYSQKIFDDEGKFLYRSNLHMVMENAIDIGSGIIPDEALLLIDSHEMEESFIK